MSDPLSSVSGVYLSSSVSVLVARKGLDAARQEGASAVSLIKAAGAAGDGGRGQAANVYPGEAGGNLDTTA